MCIRDSYPAGLPEWDLMRHCVEGTEDLGGTQWSKDLLEPANSTLWFSGKQMLPANKLKDHVGRHERTKIVGKIQKKGSQAPAREAPVDSETQKQMMAFYHKRQEEMRKLEADQDDNYTSASWANSNDLKRHFSGVGDIKFR